MFLSINVYVIVLGPVGCRYLDPPVCLYCVMNKNRVGRIVEILAAKYLIERGYKIIHQNWTCRWGEIDLVAEKDNILIFVEVRYRQFLGNMLGSEVVGFYKKKSLQRTINMYLSKNFIDKAWRLDFLFVGREGGSYKFNYYEYVAL